MINDNYNPSDRYFTQNPQPPRRAPSPKSLGSKDPTGYESRDSVNIRDLQDQDRVKTAVNAARTRQGLGGIPREFINPDCGEDGSLFKTPITAPQATPIATDGTASGIKNNIARDNGQHTPR